jgi:diguanylate cyclase (GGDEF)-like protein/PAS domain S-box-containing protein
MPTKFLAMRPRRAVLALGVVLFALCFVLRMAFSPDTGVAALYFVPVVVIAIEYGIRAGLASGLVVVVLTQIGATLSDAYSVPAASYVPRVIAVLIVGAITGYMGDRLRRATFGLREGARHFELSGDLLCTADFEGNLIHVNDSWERLLGWTKAEAMAKPFIEFVHPDDRARTEAHAKRVAETDQTTSFTNRYRTKDGDYRWLEWSSRADPDNRLIYAVARDITDRRQDERSRKEAQQRFRRIFEDSSAGIALVDLDGGVLEANETLARILGCEREELIGRRSLTEFAEPDDLPRILEGFERVLDGTIRVFRHQFRVVRSDGRRIWVDLTTSVVCDEEGKPRYWFSQLLNIQIRKEAEEQLRHLADHDPLSGVYNRRRFELELERELSHDGQHARSSAVLLFDVDGFKEVNDSLGHGAGDAVIIRLAETLRNQIRTGDVVARLGGDEFAIVLRRVGIEQAVKIATKIRELARAELAKSIESTAPISVSVGVAMIDGGERVNADELLGRADAAMYAAKRRGGDRVVSRGAGDEHQSTSSVG